MSPKIQDFASGLVKNVYGKIMPSKERDGSQAETVSPVLSLEDVAARLDNLPMRDELVASFAILQAELDRQHVLTRRLLAFVLAVQLIVMAGVGLLIMR